MSIQSINNQISYKLKQAKNQLVDKMGQFRLSLSTGVQKNNFDIFSSECLDYYEQLHGCDQSLFIDQTWTEFNSKLEKILLPQPVFSFLRFPEILATMFLADDSSLIASQFNFCKKLVKSERLQQLLKEDYVGTPIIRNYKYLTSHNRIHHLYHLLKFQDKTKVNLSNLNCVIEWGGGYGDMARLMLRINPNVTYTIIDTSLFSCVQWLYLASILGKEKVNLIQNANDNIENHKINIIPVAFIPSFNLQADAFIATWSLSESSEYSINYVKDLNFFDAKHLLIAYQLSNNQFPTAGKLGEIASAYGASIEAFEFFPENYYAFR